MWCLEQKDIYIKKWVFGGGRRETARKKKKLVHIQNVVTMGVVVVCVLWRYELFVCVLQQWKRDYPQATQSDGAAAAGRWNDSGTGSVC